MAKVSLKLEIAGRTYPISVLESEKDKVLSAANALNASIESLKKHYAVNDQQDLLAMASLQYLMKPLNNTPVDYSEIEQKLEDLTTEAQVQNIIDITNTLVENPDWKVFLPTSLLKFCCACLALI